MKLFYCLVLVLSLWDQALGSQCLQPLSKNCIITTVDSLTDQFSLPNLSGKTSLQIKGGSLISFGERLSNQLGSVQKLHLGPMGLQEIFLKTDLLEVTAMNNEIHVVRFKPSEGKYKLEKLELQGNRLRHLIGFEVLTGLTELHLEDNHLETVDFGVFDRMTNLRELHLERNQLTRVEALDVTNLPALEYLSLAGNKLTKLDASKWNFESLDTWDVSSNEFIFIDGIDVKEQFPSLQTMLLSQNEWHCQWLTDSLTMFNNSGVNVGDRDKRDDCDKLDGICCSSMEFLAENGDEKLRIIERDQKVIRDEWKQKIKNIEEIHKDKLKKLTKAVEELQEKGKTPLTLPTETVNLEEFSQLVLQGKQLKSSLESELSKFEQQKHTNEKSVTALERTIVQLRRSFQSVTRNISALQKQFKLLRETTNKLWSS